MANPEQQQITPPPELVEQLQDLGNLDAIQLAYRAGADQELEACCEWFREFYKNETWLQPDLEHFRAARRPKPPSLKERALAALGPIERTADAPVTTNRESLLLIRQALEALPND